MDLSFFDTAFDALSARVPVVLVTGRAGTGKTTLVRRLLADETVKQIVVAPTGVAALQAQGQTIHSFFQLPTQLQNLEQIKPLYGQKRILVRNLDRIIIDEISMVRADLLDKIDYALRLNRGNKKPFGGVQVLMVGDFHQLPPVVPGQEGRILAAMGYESFHALGAHCLRGLPVTVVELQQIFRQTEPEFIEMLGQIRRGGDAVDDAVDFLNTRCLGEHRAGHVPVVLTGLNSVAESYNTRKLAALPGQGRTYEGELKGEFNLTGDQLPAAPEIELKVGARVMLLKNDQNKRWVNGSLAEVVRVGSKEVSVRLDDDGKTYDISMQSWERHRYDWDQETQKVESKVTGSYSQLPVRLAWASTIHKAQGLSLSDVRINLKNGAFASGQAYVALSRARSLAGLSLAHPLRAQDIIIDRQVQELLESLRG